MLCLHDFIEEACHNVVLASDGMEALAKYLEQPFDLILLDIMLPKIDGYSVCECIWQKSGWRHSEHSDLWNETLYKQAFRVPKSVEELILTQNNGNYSIKPLLHSPEIQRQRFLLYHE